MCSPAVSFPAVHFFQHRTHANLNELAARVRFEFVSVSCFLSQVRQIIIISAPTPTEKFAFHKHRVRIHHLVKYRLTGRSVAQNEVARDVWRPVAPEISNVFSPVAAVEESPDDCDFGRGEGGGEFRYLLRKRAQYQRLFFEFFTYFVFLFKQCRITHIFRNGYCETIRK